MTSLRYEDYVAEAQSGAAKSMAAICVDGYSAGNLVEPDPAVVKRSTSRTWRIVVLSAGIRSPVQKSKDRTLIGPAEAPSNF